MQLIKLLNHGAYHFLRGLPADLSYRTRQPEQLVVQSESADKLERLVRHS